MERRRKKERKIKNRRNRGGSREEIQGNFADRK